MSTIKHGYKYQIYPTDDQVFRLEKINDLFRYVYNWGIAKEQEIYELYQTNASEYQFYSYYDLNTMFTEERNKPGNEWLKDIPLSTARLALRNVVNSYEKFFNGSNNKPSFKSKKKSKFSFNTRKDRFKIKDNCIKIEGIDDPISLGFNSELFINENWRSDSKAINPTVSKDKLGNYFISFSLEEESNDLETPKSEGIGIDVGERRTYTLSSGDIINQPKEKLEKLERRRKRQQRHCQAFNAQKIGRKISRMLVV